MLPPLSTGITLLLHINMVNHGRALPFSDPQGITPLVPVVLASKEDREYANSLSQERHVLNELGNKDSHARLMQF